MILEVTVREEGDTNDFKVLFQLRKARFFNLEGINVTRFFDILIDDL